MSDGAGTNVGRVLVVDDSPSKRYVLSSWLRRAGHTVVEAATGGEALTVMGTGAVDVVVLDVQLPDMTGFDVCEQIKGDPLHAANPVIHVSAAAVDVVDRTQGLARGADAYLVEPIDPGELLATVQAVLRYYRARQHAERLAGRLAKLARMAAQLNSATTVRELLTTAAAGTAGIYGAPAMICTQTLDGARVCAVTAGPDREVSFRPWTEGGFETTGNSVYRDEPATAWPQFDWPDGLVVRALAARRPDRPPVYVVVPMSTTDEGAPVLSQIGQTLVSALEGLRAYTQEHRLALTLQRSLLPARLPTLPEYDVAVRYVPASDYAEIGGDFYELCQLPGRLVVAVGDVAGHSLHAATIMAELRHATRAYLAEGHAPAGVLDRLNQLLLSLIPDEMATLCLLDIEPSTGAVRLANAGHPPPLLVTAGEPQYVTARTPLLGLPGPGATETRLTLERGASLLLYTDGLIERRSRAIDEGLTSLAKSARVVDDDLEAFCDRLLAEVGPTEPDDDIAVVVLRRI